MSNAEDIRRHLDALQPGDQLGDELVVARSEANDAMCEAANKFAEHMEHDPKCAGTMDAAWFRGCYRAMLSGGEG